MAAVVAQYATSLAEARTIAMLAGTIPIVFGLLKFGQNIVYTPYPLRGSFHSLGMRLDDHPNP